jgi:hypothetical protein
MVASAVEDYTEQNRYLRRYARYSSPSNHIPDGPTSGTVVPLSFPEFCSVPSAVDHLHTVYSAHLSVRLSTPPPHTARYQSFFKFFARVCVLLPDSKCILEIWKLFLRLRSFTTIDLYLEVAQARAARERLQRRRLLRYSRQVRLPSPRDQFNNNSEVVAVD